jgi:hypothetical protein
MNLRTRRRIAVSGGGSYNENPLDIDSPLGWGDGDIGYDEEFDQFASFLPSGWSWLNQGSSTYEEKFDKGVISGVAETGVHWRGILRALPSESTWEAVIKRSWQSRQGNELGTGFVLRADNGKILVFYWYSNAGTNVTYITLWNDADGSTPSIKVGPLSLQGIPGIYPRYMRIRRNSATSYDFAGSADGVVWHTISAAFDVSAFLTPTSLGFGGYNSSNNAWQMGCEFFRVRPLGWTPGSAL